MIETLASADSTSSIAIWLAIAGIVGELVIGVVLIKIAASIRRVDKLEDEVKAYASEIIETKHAQVLSAIERIESRLSDGDRRFNKLNQHDHNAEVARLSEVHALREWVMNNCATKDEQANMAKLLDALRLDFAEFRNAA